MNKQSKVNAAVSMLVLALMTSPVALIPGQAMAADAKVQVCHITGNGKGVVIEVSAKAAAAHYAHGDPLNWVLNEDGSCSPEGSGGGSQ